MPQPSWSPSTTQQLRKLVAAPYLAPNDWAPRSEAYFVSPLAQGTPGKQCGLAATGVYQPSLCSPWLAANDKRKRHRKTPAHQTARPQNCGADVAISQARKAVYEQARAQRPERWSGATRDWSRKNVVWLNPARDDAPQEEAEIREVVA
ncbi:hypothetical protein [Thiolapillus sp.]|uniref:hypothetical protein n=1 Tax=Thiolapillus sp. TaxID=2017437 RepID=UPI003AF72C58